MDQVIGNVLYFAAFTVMTLVCLYINKNVGHSVWARRVTYIPMWVFFIGMALTLWSLGLAVNDL